MKLTRKAAPVALATTLALTLAACAQSDRDSTDSPSSGGGDVKDTITFGAAGAPEIFDPFYATDGETFRVTRQMFEGLARHRARHRRGRARAGHQVGGLNEDGTEWTFTLRDDVKFHDGEPFNAEAVCYNFERMFDQNEAGAGRPGRVLGLT